MAAAPVYSVVVPCYNEEACIRETHRRLTSVLSGMGETYEIVYVNDGSRDRTPAQLDELAKADPAVRVVHFARNAGHQAAVSAGLAYAAGRAMVIIDADLQDPPEVIPDMVRLWKGGAKVVYGKRRAREGETAFKKLTASLYYRLLGKLTGGAIPRDTGDFRLADREVVDVINAMPEHARFLRGMFAWVGFEQQPLPYDREKRFAGETHYPLRKMLRLAAHGVVSFSEKPLLYSLWAGLAWLLIGFALLVALLFGGGTGLGALICLGIGSILTALGVLGAYLARVYEEVKGRPLYVVARTAGFDRVNAVPPLPPGTRRKA